MMMKKTTIVKEKKKIIDYKIVEKFIAGIVLKGSEIKSIRNRKVSISDAYISIKDFNAFVINMKISPYEKSHSLSLGDLKRDRKLLLNKEEIKRIFLTSKRNNLSIIALELFINDKGFAKLEIALAQRLKKHQLKEKKKEKEINKNIRNKNFDKI